MRLPLIARVLLSRWWEALLCWFAMMVPLARVGPAGLALPGGLPAWPSWVAVAFFTVRRPQIVFLQGRWRAGPAVPVPSLVLDAHVHERVLAWEAAHVSLCPTSGSRGPPGCRGLVPKPPPCFGRQAAWGWCS